MNLGFKDQFVEYVEDRSKTHSIRAGDRWQPGMKVHLWARPRQPGMRLIFETVCTRVQAITIRTHEDCSNSPRWIDEHPNHVPNTTRGPNGESLIVWIDGEELSADEARTLFFRDGFRKAGYCPQYQALQFWAPEPKLLKLAKPEAGEYIGKMHWTKPKSRLPFIGQLIHWAPWPQQFGSVDSIHFKLIEQRGTHV